MSAPGRSRLLRIVRFVGLGAAALFAGWWFWIKPQPAPSSYEEALDRALEPVLSGRELATKLGTASPAQVRLIAREAAQTSTQYLSPRDLELWQSVRLRVAQSSQVACARLWQGGSTEFFGPAVAALGDETLRQYTEMLGRGLALRLERRSLPEPAPGALQRGFAAIGAALSASERARFEGDLARKDLPDARACELFLAVSSGTEALDPATRTDFLRALAQALQPAPL
jgi:hypothetical protein